MLSIKDYQEKIEELYLEGKTAKEISTLLGLKYHQPVYNYFKKKGWEREGKGGRTIYSVDSDFFIHINKVEMAYILGFICADGHISEDRLVLAVAEKDVDILKKIGIDSIQVLDPTLLLDKDNWKKLLQIDDRVPTPRYILVYELLKSDILIPIAQNIAKKYSYKIVYLASQIFPYHYGKNNQ